MDDEAYAQQYSAPYSSNPLKKWGRMSQQIVDARFQAENAGVYVSAGAASRNRLALGGEVGLFALPTSWSTVHIGLLGMLAEGEPNYLTGGSLGFRLHAPTRWSPYVGMSGMVGIATTTTPADHSYVDGNGHLVMQGDPIPGTPGGFSAIVPEAGVSYWINSKARLNVGASYYVTTEGRDRDFLLFGLSLDFALRDSDASSDCIDTPTTPTVNSAPYFVPPDIGTQFEWATDQPVETKPATIPSNDEALTPAPIPDE